MIFYFSPDYYREPSPSPQDRHYRDYDRDRGRDGRDRFYDDGGFGDDFRHESSHRKRRSRKYRRHRRRSDSFSTVRLQIKCECEHSLGIKKWRISVVGRNHTEMLVGCDHTV